MLVHADGDAATTPMSMQAVEAAVDQLANAKSWQEVRAHLMGQPLIGAESVRVAKLALDHRMGTISAFDFVTEAGLLMSYGSRIVDDARRLPYYVDRIFRGTTPADLP